MSLSVCGQTGANTGLVRCSASPGVPQDWAIWGGSLTPEQQLAAATIKSALIADSKKSKSDSAKLFLMPNIQGKENKRESNTETTLSNGLKIVTREGLPGFRWSFFTSQQQIKQLRKFNGIQVPIIFNDDNKRTWGSIDGDLNFIGRTAVIYFEGLSALADADVKGLAFVEVGFIDRIQSYDDQYFVDTPFSFQSSLKGLIDVQPIVASAQTLDGTDKVLHIGLTVDIAQAGNPLNLFSAYSASALGTTAALWSVKTPAGIDVPVNTVVVNPAGYFDLNIGAVTGTHIVTLAGPTALDAANVVDIEGLELVVTVT